MRTKVHKWGNSLGVRIPKSFAKEASIDDGSAVDIKVEGNTIMVKSLAPTFNLRELVNGITPKNIHKEIDFGAPVGKELL